MTKRKGSASKPDDDAIWVESLVRSRTLTPAVNIKWGKQLAQFSPEQARHHAYAVLQAIAAAELDACLMQWATQKLGLGSDDAVKLMMIFRERRNAPTPSVTINMGNGEHIRPETAKRRAIDLFNAAFGTEVEAFLVAFLIEGLNRTPQVADQIIQEFREMRGAITAWDGLEGGDRTNG